MTTLKPGMTIQVVTVATAIPFDPSRPDNSCQDDPGLRCRDTDGRGYSCHATAGHTGDHMPYGSGGRLVATPWPNHADGGIILPDVPVADDWPTHLPRIGCEWPPPAGKRIMYKVGAHGDAICSDCIRLDTVADTFIRGRSVVQAGRTRNQDWKCSARPSGGHSYRDYCGQYGSRLR
jgi:hypothetical protein